MVTRRRNKPGAMNEKLFYTWKTRDYVPTARLDGRSEWLCVKHLRYFGKDGRVVAWPHDVEGFIQLERLHTAVRTRTFFDPWQDDSDTRVAYVVMVPRPVVAWFSRHTLTQIHDQVIEAAALGYALGGYAEEHMEADTCHFYLSSLRDRIAAIRGLSIERQQELLREDSERLPPWSAPHKPSAWRPEWAPRGCEDFPWKRPQPVYGDHFGLAVWGLTATDEENLDEGITWRRKEKERRLKIRDAKMPFGCTDTLQRTEATREPFDYMKYARHARNAWADPEQTTIDGHVYVLQDAQGRTKIGYSSDPPNVRRAQLQTGNADKLTLLGSIPGSKKLEQGLQQKYAAQQCRDGGKEWFNLSVVDVLNILSNK